MKKVGPILHFTANSMHSIIIEKCANLHIVDVFKKGAVDTVRRKQCKTSLDASSHYTDLERWPSTSIFKLYKNLVGIIFVTTKISTRKRCYINSSFK